MTPSPVAVTVVGNDRPGIVAAVTRGLYELGCNLEDATSTILRGHFSMMLVVRPPEGTDAAAIDERLRDIGDPLGLIVSARPVDEADLAPVEPTHMVSVYGADRPGIVFRVAQVLAEGGSNITDLTSRLVEDRGTEQGPPVYAVMLEVAFPEGSDPHPRIDLHGDLDVEVSIRPLETDVL